MRSFSHLAFGMLMTTSLPGQGPSNPTTLAQLRDRYRPLLLFAARPDDPALLAQMNKLKAAAPGLAERDVLVIALPYNDPAPTEVGLSAADSLAARRLFHVAPEDFTAILLGKDGGEKFRSRKPISFEKLRDTIDSMPMRQQEMRGTAAHSYD